MQFHHLITKLRSLRLETPSRTQVARVVLFLSISVALWLVLAPSVAIQNLSVAAVSARDANIYNTAYHSKIVQWPSYWATLKGSWYPPFFFVSAVITYAASRAHDAREQAIFMFLAALGALFASDLLVAALTAKFTPYFILLNLGADALGAAILALALVLVSDLLGRIVQSSNNRMIGFYGAATISLLLGVVAWTAEYFALLFFYQPAPVAFTAIAVHPMGGFHGELISKNWPGLAAEKARTPFGILSRPTPGNAPFDLGVAFSSVKAKWQNQTKTPAVLSLAAFTSCSNEQLKAKLTDTSSFTSFENINSLEIDADEGLGVVMGNLSSDIASVYARGGNEGYAFWTKRSSEPGTDVERFVFKSPVHYWSPTNHLNIAFMMSLFGVRGKNLVGPKSRQIKLLIDGKPYLITTEATVKNGNGVPCAQVPLPLVGKADVGVKAASWNLVVDIRPKHELEALSFSEHDPLVFDLSMGFVTAYGVKPDDLGKYIAVGPLTDLELTDGLESLEVDGSVVQLGRSRQLSIAHGKVDTYFTDEKKLNLSGTADALQVGSRRLNLTRWEKLQTAERTFLVTPLAAALGYLLKRLVSLLSQNGRIIWTRARL